MAIAGVLRRGAGVCAIVAGLTACTSTSQGRHLQITTPTPSPSVSASSSTIGSLPSGASGTAATSPFCVNLRSAGEQVAQEEVKLYTSNGGDPAAVKALVAELDELAADAPSSIKSALSDLAKAFGSAQSLLAHPSSNNSAQLAQLGSKLAADAQRVSTYIASTC